MKNIRAYMAGLLLASLLAVGIGVSLETYTYTAPQHTVIQRSEEGSAATNDAQPMAELPPVVTLPTAQPAIPAVYKFLATSNDGLPARWDPCTTLTWGIDWSAAPVGFKRKAFEKEAIQAMRELRSATGLGFKRSFEPDNTSILIEFAPREDMPTEDTLAYASVFLGGSDKAKQIIKSVITVDPTMRERPEYRPPSFRSVILHELGHSVGLDHADVKSEVMFPYSQDLISFQQGDRVALKKLGATNGCTPS
jgi:hypothetical protein